MAKILITRSILDRLKVWASDPLKPGLVLYGARQTGKTSLVLQIASQFRQFLHLDMRDATDLEIFRRSGKAGDFLDKLILMKGKENNHEEHFGKRSSANPAQTGGRSQGEQKGRNTLILFESACLEPQLVSLAEELLMMNPRLKIIISSSHIFSHLPGNFETMILFPFSFREFLLAGGKKEAISEFDEVPFPVSGFHRLLSLYHQYALIGGMPSVVNRFVQSRSLSALKPVYEDLMRVFFNQMSCAPFRQQKKDLLTMTLQNAFLYAGTRIKFHEFGNVPFGSREMAGIFRYLEHTLMLSLFYPVTGTAPPMQPDHNKFPRLQMADTGLMTYFSGIQQRMILATDLNALFEGQVLRHIVGQELLSSSDARHPRLDYWVRNKAQSSAEVDYILEYEDMVIPVTVKSGEPGRLRSLHQFIDEAPHPFAVRLYAGNVSIRKTSTLRGKSFYLLSLPYFLACRIREHVSGFIRYVGR